MGQLNVYRIHYHHPSCPDKCRVDVLVHSSEKEKFFAGLASGEGFAGRESLVITRGWDIVSVVRVGDGG